MLNNIKGKLKSYVAGNKSSNHSANNFGRGTDIKLKDEIVDVGGLYIIGTET